MNILVLGGDGFIGSHFVDRVFSLGHEITVFDRFSYNISRNLEHLRNKVHFIAGDFSEREDLRRALENQEIVYHFIGATNPAYSWNDPLNETEKNLKGSLHFFELATDCGVRKIVFASSGGSVYGPQYGPIKEDVLPNPINPYAITKLAIEHFLNYYRERTDVAADIYRIGNVYGPRQSLDSPQGVIAVWMGKILEGKEIQVYGNRDTLRDYVYVDDVTLLLTHSLGDCALSGIYNLGTGRGISILDLLEMFKQIIDEPFKYKLYPRRLLDNTSSVLDSSKLLSFFPNFEFQKIEDKLAETWEYVKERYREKREPIVLA